jgi:heme/copper-type cytochrome/quinol oxidase subunit 1
MLQKLNVFKKPYQILLILTIVFLLLGWMMKPVSLDFRTGDTYFVIAKSHVFFVLGIFSFLLWMLYKMLHTKMYSNKLMAVHVFFTIGTFIVLIAMFYNERFAGVLLNVDVSKNWERSLITHPPVLFMLAAQLLLPLNLIIRLLTKK